MEVYRISKAKYAAKLGASGNAARWNYNGQHVIYTASSRALASLELLVHLSGEQLGTSFKITVIHIPDDVHITNVTKSSLPGGWNGLSAYQVTQVLGAQWVSSGESCILRVPSSIVVHEYNYIINIHHQAFSRLKIIEIEDYLYDARLLEKMRS